MRRAIRKVIARICWNDLMCSVCKRLLQMRRKAHWMRAKTEIRGGNMSKKSQISRREFVGAALSAATASAMPAHDFFGASWSGGASAGDAEWKEEGVLFLDKSPYAKLHNIPVHAVTITDGFWGTRREINVDKSIPSMEKLLEANGRMDNFLRLAGKSSASQTGPVYSDSDVYKWTEAAGFALQSGDRPELHALADKIIKEVVAVQEPSGYLNTYYDGEPREGPHDAASAAVGP